MAKSARSPTRSLVHRVDLARRTSSKKKAFAANVVNRNAFAMNAFAANERSSLRTQHKRLVRFNGDIGGEQLFAANPRFPTCRVFRSLIAAGGIWSTCRQTRVNSHGFVAESAKKFPANIGEFARVRGEPAAKRRTTPPKFWQTLFAAVNNGEQCPPRTMSAANIVRWCSRRTNLQFILTD